VQGRTLSSRVRLDSVQVEVLPLSAAGAAVRVRTLLLADLSGDGTAVPFDVRGTLAAGSVTLSGAMLGSRCRRAGECAEADGDLAVGAWSNAFGVRGLTLADVALEVGMTAGPVLTSLGLSANVSFAGVTVACVTPLFLAVSVSVAHAGCRLAGRASVDLTASFVRASVPSLSLRDLAGLYNAMVPASARIPVSVLPAAVSMSNLELAVAPTCVHPAQDLISPLMNGRSGRSGTLGGVTFSKGIMASGTLSMFGVCPVSISERVRGSDLAQASLSVAVASVDTTFSGVPLTDLSLSVGLALPSLQTALQSLVATVLPTASVSLPSQLISIADTFRISAVSMTDLSLLQLARGHGPLLSATVVIDGNTHTLSTRLDVSDLSQTSLTALLSKLGVQALLPACIIDANCPGSGRCDHRDWPWTCISSCPGICSAISVPSIGCFDNPVSCPNLPDLPNLPFVALESQV
jgi:hypothetical protein